MLYDLPTWESFPANPGVYLMKNIDGQIIYIGKANNLKIRLKSYLTNRDDGREQIPFLMKHVSAIDTIIVSNEKEALLLENNLIKEYQPKYNILLKDDKTFYSLLINTNDSWPKIDLIRTKTIPTEKKGIIVFGPFPNSEACKALLNITQELFLLRRCSDKELYSRKRPCILYDMGKCVAPCVDLCTQYEYEVIVKSAILFLKNEALPTLRMLKKELISASRNLEFEKAAELHKTIQLLEKALSTQKVEKKSLADMDIIGHYRHNLNVILTVMTMRSGKLLGIDHHCFENSVEDTPSLITSFILQYYEGIKNLPQKILVPLKLPETLEPYVNTKIISPTIKAHHELILMAQKNSENHFRKIVEEENNKKSILKSMQNELRLVNFPRRIECYDNSHTLGSLPVSVFVTFIQGKSSPENYRTFISKQNHNGNDYQLFTEILERRFGNFTLNTEFPDLIIIDGGKAHLNKILRLLKNLNIHNIDVIAIAKESGKHDKGIRREKIFTPKKNEPLMLPYNSPLLLFVQKIRDEAHRFAIKFHRKQRQKNLLNNEISISGIGPVKQNLLIQTLGSWKAVFKADYQTLKQIKGISDKDIKAIFEVKNNIS